MNYEAYIQNFKGRKLPEDFERFLRLRSDLDSLFSELQEAGIHFDFLEDSDEWLTHWIGYESQIVRSVLGIATNGAGDLLAFWLYDERELKDAPIVFVGHEGDLSVMANNFTEMLPLLIGCGDLHPDALPEDIDEPYDYTLEDEITLAMEKNGSYSIGTLQSIKNRREEIVEGKLQVAKMLDVKPPRYPADLMRNAIASHPNFEEWFNTQISIEKPDYFN